MQIDLWPKYIIEDKPLGQSTYCMIIVLCVGIRKMLQVLEMFI